MDVGFFGKLPSHGDFVERRVAGAFREMWDNWLQQCIAESQRQLGNGWLDCYLTSPMWRFFLCDSVAGPGSYAGILLPSVDRVGRYFPLTVVVELPVELAALPFAQAAAGWFHEVEQLCAGALENPNFELADFDRAVAATSQRLVGLDQFRAAGPFPGRSPQWRWPSRSVDEFAAAFGSPLVATAQTTLRPMTMWWTEGSELVQPSVLLVRSLPRPDSFAAMLAGTWDGGLWDGDVSPVAAEEDDGRWADTVVAEQWPDVAVEYAIRSAGATDPGVVRKENEDHHLLNDSNRLWAVADGVGGHSHGEVASRMVIDALSDLAPTASLNAALESANVALGRVNADLCRAALGVGGSDRSGSTVVALVIRANEWAVCWAGDSRAYVYRAGALTQLTRDHTAAAEAAAELDDPLAHLAPVQDAITRAVGGDDAFQLDYTSDLIVEGDRFLLCSDGLYTTLTEASMVDCLQHDTPEEASRALIDAAREAGARDNVTAVVVEVQSTGS